MSRRRARGNAPSLCAVCCERPVAWSKPHRVDFCYACLPGGPFTPPPCQRCGSVADYYSAGLCQRCHYFAPQCYDSCRDCLAFGVLRKHKWLCWRCRSWRQRFERGTCRICGHGPLPVDGEKVCLLCRQQTVITLGTSVDDANVAGQQLFFANLPWPATRRQGRAGTARRIQPPPGGVVDRRSRTGRFFEPVEHRQLVLFDLPRDLPNARQRGTLPEPTHDGLATALDAAVLDHASRHGWPRSTITRTRHGARVLQGMQDTPGARLLASDAMALNQVELSPLTLIDAACAAGLMLDDRQPAIHDWFATNTGQLPAPMRTELDEWFEVMLHGSRTTPRRRPRSETTIRLHLRWALPALTAWASEGHRSLREIASTDVRAVLPPNGNPRATMGAGLRSILTVLKARKTIFVNPIARIVTGGYERRQPLPLDTAVIRQALDSANPACAALAALTAFHALRAGDLINAKLSDIADGRMRLGDRTIPLAMPVQVRVSAWLDHRGRRWPHTANPHMFVNLKTCTNTRPVGPRWLGLTLGMPARLLREDRILHEIEASAGDVRRICDLFGLTVEAAVRYLPNLDADADVGSHRNQPKPT